MYTIHSLSKHDYFTIPRQRQVRKIIDNYQELYHQKVEEVKNLCNGVTSRRLRLINEKINYNHIGAEASRIWMFVMPRWLKIILKINYQLLSIINKDFFLFSYCFYSFQEGNDYNVELKGGKYSKLVDVLSS